MSQISDTVSQTNVWVKGMENGISIYWTRLYSQSRGGLWRTWFNYFYLFGDQYFQESASSESTIVPKHLEILPNPNSCQTHSRSKWEKVTKMNMDTYLESVNEWRCTYNIWCICRKYWWLGVSAVDRKVLLSAVFSQEIRPRSMDYSEKHH